MDCAEATAPGGDAASSGRSGRQVGERERRLEEREHQVAEREHEIDERERRLDERERGLDERTRAIEAFVNRMEEQSRDLFEKSRAGLAASGESSDRPVAAVERSAGRGEQEQAVTGPAAGSKPDRVAAPADLKVPTERAAALRKQLRAMLAVLVATEEEVAGVLDKIAAGLPGNSEQYWRTAAEARTRAHQLREIERHLPD